MTTAGSLVVPALLPALTHSRAEAVAARFAGARVLVVGDAMLDAFIVGRVTRISPEAPVPVVAFDHDMVRIGGAANVAHNVAALGGAVTLVCVTGRDAPAADLSKACLDAGIAPAFVSDDSRRTTVKTRVVTDRNQQVARIDYETDTDVSGEVETRLVAAIEQHMPRMGAVVVSDYLKGCITERVASAAIEAARAAGVPLLVDPKVPHLSLYARATLVTPNHHEAETATHRRVRSHDEARAAAHELRQRVGCDGVLMTRGDQGMWLVADRLEGYLPAVAREVADVTGAGDTVIGVAGLALAAGATLAEAVRMANEAAGLVVAKFGPAVVTPAELLGAIRASR